MQFRAFVPMMISALRSEITSEVRNVGQTKVRQVLSVLAGAALGLGLSAGVAQAEGSADLIKRGKGYRAALLASDPTLGIVPPDGRESVALHFAYLNEGEYLHMSSSAQGIGQGKIVYRDPTGMSNRCDPAVGYIENLAKEKAGAAANDPCSVLVEPGLAGIWEVEFIPPSSDVEIADYKPVFARDEWSPQTESDFWVRAWDVSVSTAPIAEGGSFVLGRTYVRTFSGIVGADAETGQPWNSIWFGRTSDGYIYALDTNGIKGAAFNLLGSTKGLKDPNGESLYASAALDALGARVLLADPYAYADPAGEQSLKLFYSRPDQGQPAEAVSALMGPEWLIVPIADVQTMTGLEFDAERNVIVVTIEGEGLSNALELFDANDTGADGMVQFTYNNLLAGTSLLKLPAGISGDLVGRFTAKVAEMHFPMTNIPNSQSGIRVRRMNGPKDGTGDLFWNLGFEAGRFDGELVNEMNSLRGVAAAWGPEKGLGRVNDTWAMNAVQVELPLSLPTVETDLSLELALITIEPGAVDGEQVAEVELILRNEGRSNTSVIRIDIAETGGVVVESVEGALFQDGAILIDLLPAGEELRASVRALVTSANDPLAMAITGQALADNNLINDVGLVMFPEPILADLIPALVADAGLPDVQPLEVEALAAVEGVLSDEIVLMPEGDAPEVVDETAAGAALETAAGAALETAAGAALETAADIAPEPAPEPAQELASEGVVDGRLKTDLIALRKRDDGDQTEADMVFVLSNTGTETLRNVSLQVSPSRHLGDAFVSMIGEPIFEIQPTLPGSFVALNPGFSGFPGADEVFMPGGSLSPKDSVLLRMTVHYDQDALGGIMPLSLRGDFYATVNDTEYRFPSDNDFLGGKTDEDGDGNLLNDSTPLPGLRLIKSVKALPGPSTLLEFPEASDVVFEYLLENTGGLALQDLAMADLFLENEAVTEILDVEILGIDTASSAFTATSLPDAFVGLNTVQRFEGGDAVLLPGENVRVTARVVFELDTTRNAKPLLPRAAVFARVDIDGDGELDSVVGDPADTDTTMGFDADGDGEEGNDAAPIGMGRLRLATLISGEIETDGDTSFLLLKTQTTATNTGTTALGNIAVDLPLPETMIVEFIDLFQPAEVTVQPAVGEAITGPLTFDGIGDFRMIEALPTLDMGDSVAVEATFRFLVGSIDPMALTDMQAFGTAGVDRDGDDFPDFEILADVEPTQFVDEGGFTLVEQLIEAQLATDVAAAIAPGVGLTPEEVAEDPNFGADAGMVAVVDDSSLTADLSITTTNQDVSTSLATSGFVLASDGEVLISEAPQTTENAISADASLATIDDTLVATNELMADDFMQDEPAMVEGGQQWDFDDCNVSAEVDEMIAAIDDVMTDDYMTDDGMFDEGMFDDGMFDDGMIDDGWTGDDGSATFADPAQQFQQQQAAFPGIRTHPAPAAHFAAPAMPRYVVRQPKLVRKLIPGPTIGFPAGSVLVSSTSGFQLAVPEGFRAFQAPDGSFFLMRKR